MKITKELLQQIIKEEINEATQGEMEFAELEAARQDYMENRRDDETRARFGNMVEKLVEPIMSEMGLFFEAEAFFNRGDIVFTNDKNLEVTIDPLGAMGRYDVQVTPLPGAEDDFEPAKISLDSMKGVAQYVKDEFEKELSRGGTYEQPPRGMVGEPEAQTELPLENKMRITKSQLQQVIKEAIQEEMGSFGMGEKVLEMLATEFDVMEDEAPNFLRMMADKLEGKAGRPMDIPAAGKPLSGAQMDKLARDI